MDQGLFRKNEGKVSLPGPALRYLVDIMPPVISPYEKWRFERPNVERKPKEFQLSQIKLACSLSDDLAPFGVHYRFLLYELVVPEKRLGDSSSNLKWIALHD